MDSLARHQEESRGPSRMMTGMCFDNSYARLPGAFYQRCEPLPVAAPELLVLNKPLAGETLDYGPCAFLDHYDPDAVFN